MKSEPQKRFFSIPGSESRLDQFEMLADTVEAFNAEVGVEPSSSTQERPLSQEQLEKTMEQRVLVFAIRLDETRSNPSGEGPWGHAA